MIDKPKIIELSSDFQIKSELFSNIYYNKLFLTDNHTISERLTYLLSELKLGKTEFAESINVDGGQWGKVLRGKMKPTLVQILEISSKYGIRTGWIIEGEPPIYKKEKSGSFEPDIDLLTLMKKQVDDLKVNFDTLFLPLTEQPKETSNLDYPNEDFLDKLPTTDKR
jgi:transcriptional regulator with XRE-family HTH domain